MTDDFDLNWLAQGWLSWLQKIMLKAMTKLTWFKWPQAQVEAVPIDYKKNSLTTNWGSWLQQIWLQVGRLEVDWALSL